MQNAYLDPREPSFIADPREPPELAGTTLCGQKVQAGADLLFARVLENNIYSASVVCADLVASFHWTRAWRALLDVYMKHVHVENALFLPVRFVDCARLFARLEAESRFSMHNVRNHYELRLRFAELVLVLCHSRKRSAQVTSFSFAKGASVTATTIAGRSSGVSPFHPSVMQQYTKATDTLRVDALFDELGWPAAGLGPAAREETRSGSGSGSDDDNDGHATPAGYMSAFYLCLNEFMFALENTELRTEHFILYWIQCMLELHQKRARRSALFRPVLRASKEFRAVTEPLSAFLGERSVFAAAEEAGGSGALGGAGRKRKRRTGGLGAEGVASAGPHIVWVIWLVCLRYLARQRAAAKNQHDPHWPLVSVAARELLALFEFEFPMTPTCMMRYFSMLLDLLMQRQLCRFPTTIVEVMRDTQTTALPPMEKFASRPYIAVRGRCENTNDNSVAWRSVA